MLGTPVGVGARSYIRLPSTDTFDEAAGVDLVAVERRVNGEALTLGPAEQVWAARFLRETRGMTVRDIGALLGVSHPTVLKWRDNGWRPCNERLLQRG